MAGNKIVGITIDIEGKNDGLVKSLKEVDKSLAQTKSALADVDKALKIDPKNTELLTQKQELLAKQINQTNERLKVMKQVAQDAAKGLEAGTVTKEQYAKLTAEIAKAEKSLEGMQQAAEETNTALENSASGASDLTDQIKDMDDQIEKTEKALKTVDAALKLNPGNVELVATKQELLRKQVEQTTEKLELMKESAEKAAEGLEKGTTSKEEYAELTAQIATTEKELSDLEKAADPVAQAMNETAEGAKESAEGLKETSGSSKSSGEAMKALDKATGGLATALAGLAANPITAVIAAFAALIAIGKKVIDEFKKVADTIKNLVVAAVEKLGDILEGVTEQIDKAVTKLAEFTKEGASYADEVKTMAAVTGLTTDEIQRLMYISELVDVNLDTMTGAMTKLEKAMSSASKGTGSTADAFKRLGVAIKNEDGTFRKAQDVFNDLMEALGGVDDEVDRDTLAMTLFGKSAKELNPLIKASKEDLEKFNQAAQESGYILSDEVLDAYGDFDDSLQMLDKACEAAQHGLGLVLLPVLSQVASEGVPLLNELASGIVNANGDIEEIGRVIDSVLPKMLDTFVKNLPQMVEVVKKLINTFLTSLNNNLPAILDAGLEILNTLVDGLLNPESIQNIMDGVTKVVDSFCEFIEDHGAEIVDLGVYILTTLINGLSESLPKLIPAVADAITTIVEELTKPETLDTIIDAAITLFEALIDGLDKALPTILEKLPGAIQRICDKLIEKDMIGKIIDAGIKLFEAILDSGVIEEVVRFLSENSGPITDLLVKTADAFLKLKGALVDPLTEAFLQIGKTLCLSIAEGLLMGIGDKNFKVGVATFFEALKGMITGTPVTVTIPVNNNAQQPGISQGQADLINAGEGQFWHGGGSTGGSGSGTASLSAMSVYASPDYDMTAKNIVSAMEDMTIVAPVYIGDDRLDTAVTKAQSRANYVSGGRG